MARALAETFPLPHERGAQRLHVIGEGKFLAAALGVWAMVSLGLTITVASRILGKKMGALFRA